MSREYLESKPLIHFLTINGKFNGTDRDERTHQKTEVKIIMNRYFYSRSFCIIVPSGLLEEERPVVRYTNKRNIGYIVLQTKQRNTNVAKH